MRFKIKSDDWNTAIDIEEDIFSSSIRLSCTNSLSLNNGFSPDEIYVVVHKKKEWDSESGSYGKYRQYTTREEISARLIKWVTFTFFCPEEQFEALRSDIRSGLHVAEVRFDVWDQEGNLNFQISEECKLQHLSLTLVPPTTEPPTPRGVFGTAKFWLRRLLN